MWILVGILLGARAMCVVVEIFKGSATGQRYLDDPMAIFYYWEGGLVMYGGTGGIALGLYAAPSTDCTSPTPWTGLAAGFCGLAVGRVGCLLVGDDGRSCPRDRSCRSP